MRIRRTHIVIFLPPGIISLALLPLLFTFHVSRALLAQPLVALEINLPGHDTFAWVKSQYPEEQIPPEGNWASFLIEEGPAADTTRFSILRDALHTHAILRDTVRGIRIHFSRTAPYESFIHTLDILSLENLTRYWIIGQDIWVVKFRRTQILRPTEASFICGGVIMPTPHLDPIQVLATSIERYDFLYEGGFNGIAFVLFSGWFVLLIQGVLQNIRTVQPWRARRLTTR